jgi:hypothetical protein
MGYDSQPSENLPLNYNKYQVIFPTPILRFQKIFAEFTEQVRALIYPSISWRLASGSNSHARAPVASS